ATIESDVSADKGSRRTFLRTGRVPSDISVGTQDLEVHIAQSILGSLHVLVRAPAIRVPEDSNHRPLLSVGYGSSALDTWHSGKATDGIAVVTPMEADGYTAVFNGTNLDVDPSLRSLGERLNVIDVPKRKMCQDLWNRYGYQWYEVRADGNYASNVPLDATDAKAFCVHAKFAYHLKPDDAISRDVDTCHSLALEDKVDVCREQLSNAFTPLQDQQLEAFRNQRAWRWREASWGGSLWFDEDWLRRAEARQIDVSRVRFAVYEAQTEPLKASAELRDQQDKVLFRSTVVLASGARRESLPLPIGGALQIKCGKREPRKPPSTGEDSEQESAQKPDSPASEDESVTDLRVRDRLSNGDVKAVFDSDLDSGTCALVYSPSAMKRFLRRREKSAEDDGVATTDGAPRDAAGESSKPKPTAKKPVAVCLADSDAQDKADGINETIEEKSCEKRVADQNDACLARKRLAADCERDAKERTGICAWQTDQRKADQLKRSQERRAACKPEVEVTDALLALYGPQLLEVVMTRGTEPSVTKSWALDPAAESRMPLPGIKERAGDYTVVAHLKGPQPQGVIYRQAPQGTIAPGVASDLSTDLEFKALMRPRGISGSLRNWRAFVTFPIRFSGLRFPAKTSSLASSGDNTAVQLAGVRAGILAVLEPWNYDTRQTPSWIPGRFQTGFNLYDLGTGKFVPSYLPGGSITLPVLPIDGTPNARNLNSSLALGAFWEVDLERQHPFVDGNHFLLTFGIDFASLLSE